MVEPPETTWIVISGHHPENGKRERTQRVRRHVTKRQFQHAKSKSDKAELTPDTASAKLNSSRIEDAHLQGDEPREPPSSAGPALMSFEAETTQRMKRFFDIHLPGTGNSHPIFRNVLRWIKTEPYFLSTKLLNASAWDDILESGELSLWTIKQRSITTQLMNDQLQNQNERRDKYATLAAIQSLLGFELLVGDNDRIDHLQSFYESLTTQPLPPDDDVGDILERSHRILHCADRLRRLNCHNLRTPSTSATYEWTPDSLVSWGSTQHPFSFKSGSSHSDESCNADYAFLCELHHIFNNSKATTLSGSDLHRITSKHEQLSSRFEDSCSFANGAAPSTDTADCSTPLQVSVLMLTTSVLQSPNVGSSDLRIANLIVRLRQLLKPCNGGREVEDTLTRFPGALIWCYSVGVRFAYNQADRSWYMMQFLRVAQQSVREGRIESPRSLEMIVCVLEQIDRMKLGPR